MNKQNFRLDRNVIFGVAAILLWSMSVAIARSIAEKAGPLTSGASVYLIGGVILLCHTFLSKGSVKELWNVPRLYLFCCGALFVIYTVYFFLSIGIASSRSQTLEVGMVNYLWPTLSILLSIVLLSKKARVGLIPGTLLALMGLFLVLTHETKISWHSFSENLLSNPGSYGFAMVAAISWALYSNLVRRWAGNSHKGSVPLFIFVTGVVLFCLRLLYPEAYCFSVSLVLEVIFLSLIIALGYVFWDISMRKGDIVLVMVFSYFTPLLSTLVSCLYLKVIPGNSLWLGVLFVTIGSFWSWRSIESQ